MADYHSHSLKYVLLKTYGNGLVGHYIRRYLLLLPLVCNYIDLEVPYCSLNLEKVKSNKMGSRFLVLVTIPISWHLPLPFPPFPWFCFSFMLIFVVSRRCFIALGENKWAVADCVPQERLQWSQCAKLGHNVFHTTESDKPQGIYVINQCGTYDH